MAKFWEFFENLNEFVYVSDIDTYELLYMNKCMRDSFGIEPEEFKGKTCYEVLQHRDTACDTCNSSTLTAGQFDEWQRYDPEAGMEISVKDGLIEDDGRRYRIEFANAVKASTASAGTEEELAERVRELENERVATMADLALMKGKVERVQEQLDMVNGIIRSGMWYMNFDESGEMTQVVWSDKFREMLGFSGEEDFPNTVEAWSDRLHPEDKDKTLEAFWRTVRGEGEYDVEYRLMNKGGEYDWYHAVGHILTYDDGKTRLFLGIFINITEEVHTKHALEEAYQSANRANAAKTEFMANMSHDIRTPLNAIIGMTAIAGANADDPERVEQCLREITASSKHLLALVNDVLDMNRIESGAVQLNVEPLDIHELVEDFAATAEALASRKRQNLEVVVNEIEHDKVKGDFERISQCLMNLVSNAVKFTPEGGDITVTIGERKTNRPHRGCFEFVFEDNGIGMEESFLSHLFEPFARSDDERACRQSGTGLGLPITRTIAQMMNGDIKVESALDEGSKFTMTIFLELQGEDNEDGTAEADADPATEGFERTAPMSHMSSTMEGIEPVQDDDDPESPLEHIEEADFGGKRGLLVEDNELNAMIAIDILNMAGIEIDHVWNGKDAVDRMNEADDDEYDIVFMDIQMPVMGGLEATREIRSSGRDYLKTVPIVAVSANALAEDVQQSLGAGMNDHLAKPLDFDRLLEILNTYLS